MLPRPVAAGLGRWLAAAGTAGAARTGPRDRPSRSGVGLPVGGAPRARGATPAAPRPWSPSAAPTAQAIPTAGRSSDRAVVAPPTDHLDQRLPRRTHSSERTADFLAPTG